MEDVDVLCFSGLISAEFIFQACRHGVCNHVHCACTIYSTRLKPLASETMLFLCMIVSESWGNDIRRWFNLPPWTFVYGQAGSDDETWKEFLLGGEACTPVNTDSLKLSLDCLTLSTLFLPPSTIDSWQSGLIYSHEIIQSGKHCRCDGLRLKV